tara:strand:+ start:1380 stop:2246 length:867 start_codon:yes stop_codon:yes gene_type:complete
MDINNLSDQINDISLDNYKYGDETNMEIIRKLLEKINFETNINLDTETNFETFKRTKKIPCHIKNTIYSEYNDQYSQYTNQYSESDFNNNAMELDVLDDEDYIYFKLEIPDIIMNDISHNNSCDLIDYFTNVLSRQDENITNSDTYYNIVTVYQNILSYYQQPDYLSEFDKIKAFPGNYFDTILNIILNIKMGINFDTTSEDYKSMDITSKSITYGLQLILAHVNIIIKYYSRCGLTIYELTDQHIKRFVRLVNNLCVIMIFMKFYSKNVYENCNLEYFNNYNLIKNE